MLPLTLLAAQKLVDLLTVNNAIQQAIGAISSEYGVNLPVLGASQISLSAVSPDMADMNAQETYPRILLYCTQLKNMQNQKFRSFSGLALVVAEVWSSGNLLAPTGQALHYYVEGLTSILRANVGDWRDGFYFSGIYDVQVQPLKTGGFGFVESARVTCALNVSLS